MRHQQTFINISFASFQIRQIASLNLMSIDYEVSLQHGKPFKLFTGIVRIVPYVNRLSRFQITIISIIIHTNRHTYYQNRFLRLWHKSTLTQSANYYDNQSSSRIHRCANILHPFDVSFTYLSLNSRSFALLHPGGVSGN